MFPQLGARRLNPEAEKRESALEQNRVADAERRRHDRRTERVRQRRVATAHATTTRRAPSAASTYGCGYDAEHLAANEPRDAHPPRRARAPRPPSRRRVATGRRTRAEARAAECASSASDDTHRDAIDQAAAPGRRRTDDRPDRTSEQRARRRRRRARCARRASCARTGRARIGRCRAGESGRNASRGPGGTSRSASTSPIASGSCGGERGNECNGRDRARRAAQPRHRASRLMRDSTSARRATRHVADRRAGARDRRRGSRESRAPRRAPSRPSRAGSRAPTIAMTMSASHSRPRKHALDEDRSRDDARQRQRQQHDQRRQHVRQHVPEIHARATRSPSRARCARSPAPATSAMLDPRVPRDARSAHRRQESSPAASHAARDRPPRPNRAAPRPAGSRMPNAGKPQRAAAIPTTRRAVREHRDERQRQPEARRRVDRPSSRP